MSTLRLPGRADSVMVARHSIASDLEREGVDDAVLFAAKLIVSELVGNAVRHSSTSEIAITWEISPEVVRIEICDELATLPRQANPVGLAQGGRGLLLVESVARRWGAEVLEGDSGKLVWAEVDRASP